jgi:hypothetical protein
VIQPTANDLDQETPWRLGCAVLALVLVLLAAVPIAYLGYHYTLRHLPALFADPLPPTAAAELCQRFDLAGTPPCSNAPTYAYQFLPALHHRYSPGTPGDVVDRELGPYAVACTGWIARGENGDYQDCQYSLDGDRFLTLYVTQHRQPAEDQASAGVWRTCSFDVGNPSLAGIYHCAPPLNTGLLLVMSDNTFLTAPGFTAAFLAFDLLIVGLVVALRRPLRIAG